uniref:Uncharacterized protein n=1 Tax=Quercus lobata TaxID=97700 RepID=A0A7N2LL79_QUELO
MTMRTMLKFDGGVCLFTGGAVTCASLHLGEIRPGALRGNHRHHTRNETLVIWGAKTKYRLENSQVVGEGYAEVIIDADEVAVAASPSGTAHALVNVDQIRSSYFIGCQDSILLGGRLMIIELSSVRNIIDNYDKNIAGNRAEPCSSGITCLVYLDVSVNGIGNGNGIGIAKSPDLGHYIHKAKSFFHS